MREMALLLKRDAPAEIIHHRKLVRNTRGTLTSSYYGNNAE